MRITLPLRVALCLLLFNEFTNPTEAAEPKLLPKNGRESKLGGNKKLAQECIGTANSMSGKELRAMRAQRCEIFYDCLMNGLPERRKAGYATTAFLLGLLPTILTLIGPTTNQLEDMVIYAPRLAFVLGFFGVGLPTGLTDEASSHWGLKTPETPYRRTIRQWKVTHWYRTGYSSRKNAKYTSSDGIPLMSQHRQSWLHSWVEASGFFIAAAFISLFFSLYLLGRNSSVPWGCQFQWLHVLWPLSSFWAFSSFAVLQMRGYTTCKYTLRLHRKPQKGDAPAHAMSRSGDDQASGTNVVVSESTNEQDDKKGASDTEDKREVMQGDNIHQAEDIITLDTQTCSTLSFAFFMATELWPADLWTIARRSSSRSASHSDSERPDSERPTVTYRDYVPYSVDFTVKSYWRAIDISRMPHARIVVTMINMLPPIAIFCYATTVLSSSQFVEIWLVALIVGAFTFFVVIVQYITPDYTRQSDTNIRRHITREDIDAERAMAENAEDRDFIDSLQFLAYYPKKIRRGLKAVVSFPFRRSS